MEFPRIEDGDTVILDTETTGLDWKKCTTCGFVVTVERSEKPVSYYYPIRHETGHNLDADKVIEWIKSWCGKKIHIVGHNLKFDLHFFANDGIYFPNATVEDTQINGCLIDEHSKSFSLEAQAVKFGAPAKKGKPLYAYMATIFGGDPTQKQMGNFWRLAADDPNAIEYATGDGDSTFWLWKHQQPYLDLDELREAWKLECRTLPVLFRMERKGVRVSEDRFEFLKSWVERQLEIAVSRLPHGLNVRSSVQLQKAFTDEGITDWPTTPKGNPSFVEMWLSQTHLGRDIIQVRRLTNLDSTFIKSAVEGNLHKGRIHCNFNQLRADEYGTITGRLSSSGPNMQQIPKRDKFLAPIFRSIFYPDDECYWSTNDYSQQEYRVFAAYTGSKNLIEGYKSGLDMHQVVADMLGVARDPTAKRMNLGMLYWMGVPKLAESLGISVEEAQEHRRIYDERIPEVKKFLNRCQRAGKARGWMKTIKGRRARFPDRNFAYKGASRVIQGTCADLTKEKMCEVDEFLNKESGGELGVQLQVHDALDFSVPIGREDINEEAIRIMSDFSDYPLLNVPMKVDHGRGENWGDASFPDMDWIKYHE